MANHSHGSQYGHSKWNSPAHEAHMLCVPQLTHSTNKLGDVRADVEDFDANVRGLIKYRLCDDVSQIEGYVLGHCTEECKICCAQDNCLLLTSYQSLVEESMYIPQGR